MRLRLAIDDFLLGRERAPRTTEWYAEKLLRFRTWCEDQGVTDTDALEPPVVRRFLSEVRLRPGHLGHGHVSSQTLHGYARTLRAFCYFGAENGWYTPAWIAWWKKGMPKRQQKTIPTFTRAHIQRLMLACGERPRRVLRERDKAILLLLLDTGIRASELCTLTVQRTHLGVGDSFVDVTGKGEKQRTVGPLGRLCQRQLIRYVTHFRRPAPGVDTLFVGDEGQPLHLAGLDAILKQLRDTAGIEDVRVSAHTFRHTYAVTYLAAPGANIYKLSLLMGHSTVTTTEVYLRDFQAREARRGPSVADQLL